MELTPGPDAITTTFQEAAFGGIEFPYTERSITGSVGHVVHKYIHRPGGKVEVLSRNLMEFRFKCPFHTTIPSMPDAYPTRLAALISLHDSLQTYDLVVPGLGTVKAKMIHYTRDLRAAVISGESIELTFLENTDDQFTTLQNIGATRASLPMQFDALYSYATDMGAPTDVMARLDDLDTSVSDLLSAVAGAIEEVAAIGILVGAVIAGCTVVDRTPWFQDPNNIEAWLALQEVLWTAVSLSGDALELHGELVAYVTPEPMTIMQVSMAVYDGDASRGLELLQLNDVRDALHVPALTLIRHYAA